jgi:hypothetical protein
MKIPQVESDIDFEVVNSYTTDLSGIHNIITVDDKSTWVNVSLLLFVVMRRGAVNSLCLLLSY